MNTIECFTHIQWKQPRCCKAENVIFYRQKSKNIYFNCIKKHWIFISLAQWFWTRPSGGRSLIHEFLTGQSCIIGLSVPSATLCCTWRSVRRLSDRHLTRERMFCSANFALRVFHTEWNRKSFKMNFQRIQLNVSPIFSESRRGNVKQKMSFSTEKKRKISFMQN